jgi:peptide/nickel transport system permease protein
MGSFLLRRFAFAIPIFVLISVVTFGLLVGLGVDPAAGILTSDENATIEDYLELRKLYGLDEALPLRYGKWAWATLRGDFGYSARYKQPVFAIILPRIVNTLVLSGVAISIAILASLLIGVYSAVRQYSWGDSVITVLTFLGFSVPSFWFGLMLIIIVGVWLGWLPTGGAYAITLTENTGIWSSLADRARHLVLPATVIAFPALAEFTRYVRSSMLEVIEQGYVQTARAKGLSELVVLGKHALRNALIPFVTVAAWSLPNILNGSIAVETVFAYPGMGRLLYDSVIEADFNLALLLVMFMLAMVLVANCIADILYAWLDPRIRYQ